MSAHAPGSELFSASPADPEKLSVRALILISEIPAAAEVAAEAAEVEAARNRQEGASAIRGARR
jgi:hypothetical protein